MSSKASSIKTRSEASTNSSTGFAAARARAKAEAAKARLGFAAKEMDLKVEKAKIEASIEFLQHEKCVASAIAEAEALEAVVVTQVEARSNPCSFVTSELTKQYVLSQAEFVKQGKYVTQPSQCENAPQSKSKLTSNQLLQPTKQSDSQQITFGPPNELKNFQNARVISSSPHIHNNYSACWSDQVSASNFDDFRPSCQEPINPNVSDFIRYFARREIVATGLLQFNDKPQNFRAWKRSFKNATNGLHLTSEEMDLMLKWLGKESSEHVEQIRAIHINNPTKGLNMMWDRLEQCYGSAEVIEDTLFKRIDIFPKIPSKDYTKLRKFSDLLMEMQSAKAKGGLPGLAFLDTARGLNPIVQKLPFNLQERWITVGANYKRTRVPFPPFNVFVDFVTQEANARNDPSFNFTFFPKLDKLPWRAYKQKEISVHKTNVVSRYNLDTQRTANKAVDSDKLCPIHMKPHPLSKCRSFRMKTLDDRKAFLKENHICFKCCSSSTHIAKNCMVKIQCSECLDEKHCTALHPGPAPWLKETEPAAEYGGECDSAKSEEITSKCTQVCGMNKAGRSCSKISLVKVYPAGHPEQAVRLYAIHDEQSNRSLVCPEFFEMSDSDSEPAHCKIWSGSQRPLACEQIGLNKP
ncbi:uncharacterized protein LOC133568240 [Nerophis ophidion]|uniref:uncharacterized protein LOC133568240 n=1 Tax=Nerophis ophidion TaxID=159077 RepID=UPI002ADF36D4|nr:uncharacterized protein LOC133568240 [Nerophis ophidion]